MDDLKPGCFYLACTLFDMDHLQALYTLISESKYATWPRPIDLTIINQKNMILSHKKNQKNNKSDKSVYYG